ncbi:MAG: hypothetical protein KQH83_08630 [Actinobacteria bacterium]|nr:hypothetical protein [Actinomycetota bacterium]
MGFKTGLLIGAAAGYVLGAKAGRERYQQIMDGWGRITGDPRFQDIASRGKAVVDLAAERVKGAVEERLDGDET